MRWSLILPIVILAGPPMHAQTGADACAQGQQPFLVAPTRIYRSVKTLAVVPIASEYAWSAEAAARLPELDSLLMRAFRAGGLAVVPQAAADSVWPAVADTTDAAQGKYREALREQFNVDAMVFPTLVVKDAQSTSLTNVSWDGTRQAYRSTGAAVGEVAAGAVIVTLLESLLGPADEDSEAEPDPVILADAALSMEVVIEDMAGQRLYDGWGGIQLVRYMRGRGLVPVPDSLLLSSDKRNAVAVQLALCPLLRWKPAP